MRKSVVWTLVIALGLISVIAIGATALTAGEEDTKGKATASKSRGGGEDENIKTAKATNTKESAAKAPPAKGGEKTRGGWCWIKVDNWTGWYMDIYVDGYHKGYVAPYGDSGGWFTSGRHSMYARADFDDGTYLYWGPTTIHCGNQYTWELYD